MRIRTIINRTFGGEGKGGVAGAINAAVSASVNERGTRRTRVTSHQRIVQRGGRTVVREERSAEAEDR